MLCVCACVCVCVQARARAHADPVIVVFVPGVEYGFICVYSVMWELSKGMFWILL